MLCVCSFDSRSFRQVELSSFLPPSRQHPLRSERSDIITRASWRCMMLVSRLILWAIGRISHIRRLVLRHTHKSDDPDCDVYRHGYQIKVDVREPGKKRSNFNALFRLEITTQKSRISKNVSECSKTNFLIYATVQKQNQILGRYATTCLGGASTEPFLFGRINLIQ